MKISIITASYNYEQYIQQAIESVIAQSYNDWELIIVDDGSKDNSLKVIQPFVEKYENIKLFQHEGGVNKGLKDTLLLGLSKASGEYIAFLESDDYWREDHLEKKIEILQQNPEVKFIYNQTEFFGDEAVIEVYRKITDNHKTENEPDTYKYMPFSFLEMSVVGTFSSMLINKDVLKKCDFNTPYGPYLDWWLCHQIALKYKMYFLNEKLTFWRLHKNSYTNDKYDKVNQQKIDNYYRKLYQNYLCNMSKIMIANKMKLQICMLLFVKWIVIPKFLNKIFRGGINKMQRAIISF